VDLQASVETQHAVAGAIIERGVLEHLLAFQLDHFDVDLNRVAGCVLLEQLELSRLPLGCRREQRHADLSKYSLDSFGVHAQLVHTLEPHLRP
jgi:hypothetical protein